jgi:muconolactone delta-isomerase
MRFMLTFTWKQQPNEEVMALMPAEQAREKELVEQGISESANIAADRSAFWTVWHLASRDEVQETLQTLPLYNFVNVSVSPLAER